MTQPVSLLLRTRHRARRGVFVAVAVLCAAFLSGLQPRGTESEAGSPGEGSQLLGAVVFRQEPSGGRASRGGQRDVIPHGATSVKTRSTVRRPAGPPLAFDSHGGTAALLPFLC